METHLANLIFLNHVPTAHCSLRCLLLYTSRDTCVGKPVQDILTSGLVMGEQDWLTRFLEHIYPLPDCSNPTRPLNKTATFELTSFLFLLTPLYSSIWSSSKNLSMYSLRINKTPNMMSHGINSSIWGEFIKPIYSLRITKTTKQMCHAHISSTHQLKYTAVRNLKPGGIWYYTKTASTIRYMVNPTYHNKTKPNSIGLDCKM